MACRPAGADASEAKNTYPIQRGGADIKNLSARRVEHSHRAFRQSFLARAARMDREARALVRRADAVKQMVGPRLGQEAELPSNRSPRAGQRNWPTGSPRLPEVQLLSRVLAASGESRVGAIAARLHEASGPRPRPASLVNVAFP